MALTQLGSGDTVPKKTQENRHSLRVVGPSRQDAAGRASSALV